MSPFLKNNKLVFAAALFSVVALIAGIYLNIGGIAIAALLTSVISLRELSRKFFRQLRYSRWIEENSDKIVVNLYSDVEQEGNFGSIAKELGANYLVVSGASIRSDVLLDLADSNGFHLDDSIVLNLSSDDKEVHDIQTNYDQYISGELNMMELIDHIKSLEK